MTYKRIIPADAGSTQINSWTTRISWDHPRGCGEHQRTTNDDTREQGSSPRMRGAPADTEGAVTGD